MVTEKWDFPRPDGAVTESEAGTLEIQGLPEIESMLNLVRPCTQIKK